MNGLAPMTARFPRPLTAVFVLLVSSAREGKAQQSFSWTDYCTIGSLQFCSSVEISLQPSVTTHYIPSTLLTIRLRNLEGALGTRPWGLIGVSIANMNSTLNGSNFLYLSPRPPHTSGAWEFAYYNFPTGDQQFYVSAMRGNPYHTSVVGCNIPAALNYGPHPFRHAQTCGGSGWVEFSFDLNGAWSFNSQTEVSLTGYYDNDTPYGSQFNCTLDSTCVMVTPEPGTIALLSTGLVALGGAWKRRRNGGEPE